MTVKELKEALNRFDDNLMVLFPKEVNYEGITFPYAHVTNVSQGFNELDGCVFIDDYIKEED